MLRLVAVLTRRECCLRVHIDYSCALGFVDGLAVNTLAGSIAVLKSSTGSIRSRIAMMRSWLRSSSVWVAKPFHDCFLSECVCVLPYPTWPRKDDFPERICGRFFSVVFRTFSQPANRDLRQAVGGRLVDKSKREIPCEGSWQYIVDNKLTGAGYSAPVIGNWPEGRYLNGGKSIEPIRSLKFGLTLRRSAMLPVTVIYAPV